MEGYKGPRKVLRRALNVKLAVRIHKSSAGEVNLPQDVMEADTSDIGDNGLNFYFPMAIPDGTYLDIELDSAPFYSKKREQIHILGKVTFSAKVGERYQIGVNFTEISDEDKRVIMSYIQG